MTTETLSSDLQFFRTGLPVFVSIMAGCIMAAIFYRGWVVDTPSLLFATAVPLALVTGLVLIRRTAATYADEVRLTEGALIVRERGTESRIRLVDIADVRSNLLLQPGITLILRAPGPFGDRVRFLPANAYFALSFNRNKTARRLESLVEEARRKERAR